MGDGAGSSSRSSISSSPGGAPSTASRVGHVGAGALAAVLMGCLGPFVKHVSSGAAVISFLRLALGLVFLVAFMLIRGKTISTRTDRFLLLSGLASALSILLYIESLERIDVGKAAFILYLAPVLSTILARLFLDERLSWYNVLFVALSFCGLPLLAGLDLEFSWSDMSGLLLGIGAALSYSTYVLLNRKIDRRIDAANRSVQQLLVGALFILPFALAFPGRFRPADLEFMALIAFFDGFVSLTLVAFALIRLKAFEWGTISYLEPLSAAVLGVVVLGESTGAVQIAGYILILAGGAGQALSPLFTRRKGKVRSKNRSSGDDDADAG